MKQLYEKQTHVVTSGYSLKGNAPLMRKELLKRGRTSLNALPLFIHLDPAFL